MTFAILATTTLLLPFALKGHADTGGDVRYQRAHAAAVKYRHRAEDLQRRLTRRVVEARGLRRTLLHQASSLEALRLAAIAYHVPYSLLYRIASCESTGGEGLNPNAKNRSSTASGLAQFLTSTWAGTAYRAESIFSPYASALAMAAEVAHGNANWQWAASRRCWA